MGNDGNAPIDSTRSSLRAAQRDGNVAKANEAMADLRARGRTGHGDALIYVSTLLAAGDHRASRAAAKLIGQLVLDRRLNLDELGQLLDDVEQLPDPAAERRIYGVCQFPSLLPLEERDATATRARPPAGP